MKKFAIFAVVAIWTTAAIGCRCGGFQPWRFGAPPISQTPVVGETVVTPPVYSQPDMAIPTPVAPSSGCGPGCGSCGGNSPPVLSGPQTLLPGPDTGLVLGQ